MSGAHSIRNLAIVAHVDHGKTTLSDALLLKAGLLHKDRAGEQRSMDTLADEKERGITIKSAAISLNLTADWHVMKHGKAGDALRKAAAAKEEQVFETEVKKDEEDAKLVSVYMGKFPISVQSAENVQGILKDHGISVDLADIDFRGRRNYAILNVSKELAERLIGLPNDVSVEGRALSVEYAGDAAMIRLQKLCQETKRGMPKITVLADNNGEFSGLAEWMGGVMIHSSSRHSSKAKAREAAAKECIAFMEAQQRDFQQPNRVEERAEARDDTQVPGVAAPPKADEAVAVFSNKAPINLNLIDCPGHIDFNGEVTAALRICDGALVVVDAVEGKAVQTDNVLFQALKEGVRPVLMLNKVDRLIVDKQLEPEDVFKQMERVIHDVNAFIEQHQLPQLPDQRVRWEDGSICFGSGYYGWSASVDSFLTDDGVNSEAYNRLRKAVTKRENFIKLAIKPVMRLHRLCGVLPMKKNVPDSERVQLIEGFLSKALAKPFKMPASLRINEESPKKLLKKVMMAWLPAADAITNMIASNAPSPVEAQQWRAPLLYTGDRNDPSGKAIRDCDAAGPTTIYVSKMLPGVGKSLLAYGRIFSGELRAGDSLFAIARGGTHTRLAKVSKVMKCGLGGNFNSVPVAGVGQLVAIEGVDKALDKAGTLSSAADSSEIKHMEFAVAPVVQQSICPKDKHLLTKMIAGMQQVVNGDSTAEFFRDPETDQYILAGAGELHMEILVSSLRQNTGIDVVLSDPLVSYRETVLSESSLPALAKSDNKHNRIWMKASPLSKELVVALTNGDLYGLDVKATGKKLSESHGWSSADASRLWAVGPEAMTHLAASEMDRPSCLLVDGTFGLQIPDDAKANIIAAFRQVVRQGVLLGSPLRGVRFELVDAKFHTDAVHRRPNSVVPAAARACKGAFLLAEPSLLEPVFRATVMGAHGTINKAFSVLGGRCGHVVDSSSNEAGDTVEARLPVRCSFGLVGALHGETKGQAQCSLSFDGFQSVLDHQDKDLIISETRSKKNLPTKPPGAEVFIDKL